ncbi:hypothetical protein V6N13_120155 [Hibiscus sabdariffa]
MFTSKVHIDQLQRQQHYLSHGSEHRLHLPSLHDHDAAEFHAVARAVGGCGVYVSDKPGGHDFLVDQAKHAGRLSRDCLFTDPVMDGKRAFPVPSSLESGQISPGCVEYFEEVSGQV